MKYKIGGGSHLQLYDPSDGQYVEENYKSLNKADIENIVMLYVFGLDYDHLKIHFPDPKIHDEEYCKLFTKYIRDFISNVDVIIDPPKMNYLLSEQKGRDKSKFLLNIGYSPNNPGELSDDIRWNTEFKTTQFKLLNDFTYNVMAKTKLKGYIVTTGWQINKDGSVRFLTLVPGGDKQWK